MKKKNIVKNQMNSRMWELFRQPFMDTFCWLISNKILQDRNAKDIFDMQCKVYFSLNNFILVRKHQKYLMTWETHSVDSTINYATHYTFKVRILTLSSDFKVFFKIRIWILTLNWSLIYRYYTTDDSSSTVEMFRESVWFGSNTAVELRREQLMFLWGEINFQLHSFWLSNIESRLRTVSWLTCLIVHAEFITIGQPRCPKMQKLIKTEVIRNLNDRGNWRIDSFMF